MSLLNLQDAMPEKLLRGYVSGKSSAFYSDSDTPRYQGWRYASGSPPEKKKLTVNTIKAYKSAIMQLIKYKKGIEDSYLLKTVLKSLDESNIIRNQRTEFDIKYIINHFNRIGPSDELDAKSLTSKTCWLLIYDYQTIITENSVKLIVVAPKEKKKGKNIEKFVVIKAHRDPILCPVAAYSAYKRKMVTSLCLIPHVNDKSIIVNHLFRYLNESSKPLTVDSISKNIKYVSNANWSSYYMFDTYYCLSKDSGDNLTESILL
ncbi:hypothetical protein BB561_004140 [Smittium simulii]|uniref:Uncharacterized protein n=1 Tax=Smittium simulii TaxID=133385 RepID=A0A2T9YHU8_9FUNG|nr:hypothetical protein BB561_004140 [Smittium simulii]